MGKTQTYSVTSGADEPVIVAVACKRITVGEDALVADFPTTEFTVKKPTNADEPRGVQRGGTYTFEKDGGRGSFVAGETVGHIRTVTGTTTFFQDEDGK